MHYIGTFKDGGGVFDSSRAKNRTFRFKVARERGGEGEKTYRNDHVLPRILMCYTLPFLLPSSFLLFPLPPSSPRFTSFSSSFLLPLNSLSFFSPPPSSPRFNQVGVGMVIAGWDEGVIKMSLGERAMLHIPSAMGYGVDGAGDAIPPNADLIFDVELLGIEGTMSKGGSGQGRCAIL